MTRSGITYEQVTAAAAALKAEGVYPSIAKVRARLGDTGSETTLSKHLLAWRQGQEAEQAVEPIPCPPTVTTALQAVSKAVTDALTVKGEAVRRELDEENAEIRAEAENLLGKNAELEAGGERLKAHIEILKDELRQNIALAKTNRERSEQLQGQLNAALMEQAEISHLRIQVADLRGELAEVRAALSAMTERAAAAEALVARKHSDRAEAPPPIAVVDAVVQPQPDKEPDKPARKKNVPMSKAK